MREEANIVEQYADADTSGRIDILIKYYPNFLRLVEGYEQSLSYIIKQEKEYKHRAARGDLGVADGAYSSEELAAKAADKNISIFTTNALGRTPREILAQFQLTENALQVASCPEGHTPKSSSYVLQSNSIRASFPRSCCEGCPHQKECLASIKVNTAVVNIPLTSWRRATELASDQDNELRLS